VCQLKVLLGSVLIVMRQYYFLSIFYPLWIVVKLCSNYRIWM